MSERSKGFVISEFFLQIGRIISLYPNDAYSTLAQKRRLLAGDSFSRGKSAIKLKGLIKKLISLGENRQYGK